MKKFFKIWAMLLGFLIGLFGLGGVIIWASISFSPPQYIIPVMLVGLITLGTAIGSVVFCLLDE